MHGTVYSPHRLLLCGMVLSYLLFSSHVALGQTQSDSDLMSLSLEELAKTKVFSASRHLEDLHEAPSAVSIITAEDIQRYGWRTLADVIGSLRGFYTSYDRDYTYLGVRGFLRPGDFNSRILLLVNGHRLNEAVYGSAPLGSEFPLDLDLVDHIEVVRGPSSSLYGTNAIFGVINVVTRRANGASAVEVAGEESSFLNRTGRLTGSVTKGRLSAVLSGSMYRSDGHSQLYYPEFSDVNDGIAQNLDGEHYSNAFADLQDGDLRIQGQFGIRTKIMPTAPFGTTFDEPGTDGTDRGAYVDVEYHRNLSPVTDFDLKTYYDEYDFGGGAAFGDQQFVTTARSDSLGTEINVSRKIGRQRITAGTDFQYSLRVEQKNFTGASTPSFDDHRTPWFVAPYAETELNLVPRLTIHAGARLDWFDTFGGALSPRVALVYQANSRTSLKYIFGRAFRAPNAYESYYEDGVSIVRPTAALKPEHIQSNELVVEHSLRPWLELTGDGFFANLTNLIDEVPDPVSGLNHFVNIGHDGSKGVEFEAEAKRVSGWEARASYTFSDARDEANKIALQNSPTSLAKLNGAAPLTHASFVGLELLYTSPQKSYQGTNVNGAFLTNITFSTKPLWGGWQFSASCYNAFNRQWFDPAGPGLVQPEIQQDGRTYRFKIVYRLPLEKVRPKQ